MIKSPRIGPQQVLYQDKYQKISKVVADFGDFTKEYFVRDVGHRAGVLIVRDGKVLLTRQWRLLIDGLSWEIPGGKVDEGETPEAAAARECLEETGLWCKVLKPLIEFLPGLDISHNPTHVFYTEDFEETGEAHSDPGEVLQLEWVPLERCISMIFSGEIQESLSMISIMIYNTLKQNGGVPHFGS